MMDLGPHPRQGFVFFTDGLLKNPSSIIQGLQEIFGTRLKKIICFGKQDLLLLFSTLKKEDASEVFELAEEWSHTHETPLSPLVMDQKSFNQLRTQKKQLIREIEKTGVEI